jgi:hypothetical protein
MTVVRKAEHERKVTEIALASIKMRQRFKEAKGCQILVNTHPRLLSEDATGVIRRKADVAGDFVQ